MTNRTDLLYAILSMDSYNREYEEGIAGLGGTGSKVGEATLQARPANTDLSAWQAFGFYASAYRLADGSTVISYRGTNNYDLSSSANDILNGWVAGAGTQTGQTKYALQARSS